MTDDARSLWKTAAEAALLRGASAALVAMFCDVTTRLVPSLTEPYWAPIAAVVVLYPQTEATRKASTDRFFGTFIGSMIGWASATWWNHSVWFYGLAVFIAVGLCYLLRLENASRICAVAVTVITVIPRSAPAYVVAFHRFVEVSYGVACAVTYTLALDAVRRRWPARGSPPPPAP